jgi:fatty acid desaturase
VRVIALSSAAIWPLAILLFWNFNVWFAGAYLAVVAYFAGPMILMLHNISHRRAFRPRFDFIYRYIDWALGPMMGLTPNTYFAHHIGMHHAEGNLLADLSSTMPYQRDSLFDFGRYFFRFLLWGQVDLLRYLWRRRSRKLFWKVARGELIFYAVVALALWFNWQAALVVFVAPLVLIRFAMMSGNWAQHAFVDGEAPDNTFRNTITCINTLYNRRCFNDGYHIGHHLKPNRHWIEMPEDFLKNRQEYAREGAIVFDGLDYFMVWTCLMTKQYQVLARHYVQLEGSRPDEAAIADMLRQRTRRIAA